MSTFDSVKQVLVQRFKVDASAITPETTLEDLDFDSLFLAEFLIVVGEELQVKVPDNAVTPQDTVSAVVRQIEERRSEAGTPS